MKSKDLTTQSLAKGILWFSLPLVVSNLLQVLFNAADVAVVGQFSGSSAMGSVGSTSTLANLFVGFLIGLGSGINVLVARYMGSQNDTGTARTVKSAFAVSLAIGLVLMAAGLLLAEPLLRLIDTKEDLLDGAVLYFRIFMCGMPAMSVFNFGNAVYSASGNTKLPLCFLLISGILNVGLNLFFVCVCKMSVDGVGLATVISQYICAVFVVLSLIKSKQSFALRLDGSTKIGRNFVRDILVIGIPSGLQNALFHVANLFIQSGINSFDTAQVKGNVAAQNADALVFDVMAAFYTACASYISQNFAAKKYDRVTKTFWISLVYSFGSAAILGGILLLMGEKFIMIFTDEPEIARLGVERLTIMASTYCLSAFMDTAISAARGLGKSIVPTVIVIVGTCLFRITWIYTIFAFIHTVPALYLLYPASWIVTAVAEMIYFVHIYRKLRQEESDGKGIAA